MIGFVILHYMVLEETITCVDSLKKLDGEKKIIIVDNFSSNDTGKKLQEMYQNDPEIHVILNQENLGFAKANNIGYEYAMQFKPKFVVVMNNDTEIVNHDFYEKVEQLYKETNFAVLGPDIYSTSQEYHQNPKKNHHVDLSYIKKVKKDAEFKLNHSMYSKLRIMLKKNKILNKYYQNSTKENDYQHASEDVVLHGSFLVYSPIFMTHFDTPFFEGTFFYLETEILDIALQHKKLKSVYTPELKVLHHQNVSTKSVMSSEYKRAKFANDNLVNSATNFLEYVSQNKNESW